MSWMDRLNERAELMGRMMSAIGAVNKPNTGFSGANVLRVAATRCLSCGHTKECREWLDAHPEGAAHAPAICPNANLFKEWARYG